MNPDTCASLSSTSTRNFSRNLKKNYTEREKKSYKLALTSTCIASIWKTRTKNEERRAVQSGELGFPTSRLCSLAFHSYVILEIQREMFFSYVILEIQQEIFSYVVLGIQQEMFFLSHEPHMNLVGGRIFLIGFEISFILSYVTIRRKERLYCSGDTYQNHSSVKL